MTELESRTPALRVPVIRAAILSNLVGGEMLQVQQPANCYLTASYSYPTTIFALVTTTPPSPVPAGTPSLTNGHTQSSQRRPLCPP